MITPGLKFLVALIIRSTPPNRSNNIRGRNVRPSVRMSLRTFVYPSTKSFPDFNEIWCVDRGR